jgi:hypothetical protein
MFATKQATCRALGVPYIPCDGVPSRAVTRTPSTMPGLGISEGLLLPKLVVLPSTQPVGSAVARGTVPYDSMECYWFDEWHLPSAIAKNGEQVGSGAILGGLEV